MMIARTLDMLEKHMPDYRDPNAQDETVSMDVDHLIECPVCGEYRHKTWFRAGERGCWGCVRHQKLWLTALQAELRAVQQVTRRN
jgi:hypothetical protein